MPRGPSIGEGARSVLRDLRAVQERRASTTAFEHLYNRRIYLAVAAAVAIAVVAIMMQYVMDAEMDEKSRARLMTLMLVGAGGVISFIILGFALHRFGMALKVDSQNPKHAYYMKRTASLSVAAFAAALVWAIAFYVLMTMNASEPTPKVVHAMIMTASAILIVIAAIVLPNWRGIRESPNMMRARAWMQSRSMGGNMYNRPGGVQTIGAEDADE
jgi:heme/copper-type cytochrome/quinol oxidase subunit 4